MLCRLPSKWYHRLSMGKTGTAFFTRDRAFYKTFLSMLTLVALQNLVAYSVNMADNIMLGAYSQEVLSGAAIVNQVFFVVQQVALALANSLSALASQYWGKQETRPIRTLTGITVKVSMVISAVIIAVCWLWPRQLLGLFTPEERIISQGLEYLSLLKWTFLLFIIYSVLVAALRSAGIVNIAFYVSVVSLVVNVGINYTLIYGRFGFPELGIRGAAIGTFVARTLEVLIVLAYALLKEKRLRMFSEGFLARDRALFKDYLKVMWPILLSSLVWGISVPLQTAILGHLSDTAIAANSVATTFYQYLKVVVRAMATVSAVLIGNSIGRGDLDAVKAEARTLNVICVGIGVVLGLMLFFLRGPLLSLYSLTEEATELSKELIALMSVIMVGMSYQMPLSSGIFQGGGDVKFGMKLNIISIWCVVMPLSFLTAFVWKLPVPVVVLAIQSDQLFKGIPDFIHFRSYKWIKKLTR